jgi:hypothetical protein
MVYHPLAILEFIKEIDRQGMGGILIMSGGYPFVQNPFLYENLGIRFSGANAREAIEQANLIIP